MPHDYTPKDIARFNSHVKVMPSGCHEWQGTLRNGYGRVKMGGKLMNSNRVAWEIENGPVPDGMFVCHSCDNPRCCRVSHLWIGTQEDNVRDMRSKSRGNNVVGERHGLSKITSEDVLAIRAAYSSGESQSKIAATYGIAQTNVSSIVRRVTWPQVS